MNDSSLGGRDKKNLLSVLDYLLHLDRVRSRPVFRLSDHRLPFFHEHAFQGLPGVGRNLIDGAEEVWLSIRRLQANPPPTPPDLLRPWINIQNDPGKKPILADSLTIQAKDHTDALELNSNDTPPEEVILEIEDVPEIQQLFDHYISEWKPWSEAESARRKTIHKYDQFFSLIQDVEAGGGTEDSIEIAWGIGIALWDKENEADSILYPLISRTVELSIDSQTMSITVRPTEREPVVHVDAFGAFEISQATDVEKRARAEFETSEKTLSPFDPPTFEGILRYSASQLDSHGVYWPDERKQEDDRTLPSSSGNLLITDTWVIYARKRSTNFIAADVQRLKQAVNDAESLPSLPSLIMTEPSDQPIVRKQRFYRGISSPGLADAGWAEGTADDSVLFFPKPFNEEQVSIIDRLDQADGVVVQGPPGTGKTHTIANVICHHLALGKKVLVSAQHEAPLAVLQDQIPEALRPLTISLLTSEREGLRQLEQSVRKIASEVNILSESELNRDIRAESDRIDRMHQQLASLDRELREWASKQTSETPFLGDNTRPEQLARYIVEQEQRNNWFPDLLDGTESTRPGFSDEDIESLRSARRELGEDLIYLNKVIPQHDTLPLSEDMARLHGDLRQLGELNHDVFEIGNVPPLRQYTLEHLKKLEEFQGLVAKAHAVLKAGTQFEWQATARQLLAKTSDTPVGHHLREWVRMSISLEKERQQFLGDVLTIPIQAETHGGVFEAVKRLSQGKRAFGLFGGDSDAKQLVQAIRMGGMEPVSADQWDRVKHYLETAQTATKLTAQWAQLRVEFGGPELGVEGFTAIKFMADLARPLANIWAFDSKIANLLIEDAKKLFASGIEFNQLANSIEELERLRTAIDNHLRHSRLKVAAKSRNDIEETIKKCDGPVVCKIREFVRSVLGTGNTSADIVMEHWSGLLDELHRLDELQGAWKIVTEVTGAIEVSGARVWAHLLRTEPPSEHSDRWLPSEWREAWEWARARGYLDQIDGQKALRRLAHDRALAEEELQRAYLRVVELRTWRELKRNMTPKVGAALNAYLSAIARIGRGMGIRAVRFRQDARSAMMKAYAATPCWIMAHWRVSESLPPELGMFDLLIIDEASQSDVWALPAIVRAKKILVVGDDKQVSPSDVGLKESDIRTLRQRFLSAIPYGENLLPGTSIYDLGSTMFAADVIRLREHFRCVTPIIEFSNRQFYNHEIKPLRVPKPSERLDPPLIDVYVKGGYRTARKKINKPEATAIVEEIKRIVADPAMTHRTIGVVSLLGFDQAKYIQEKLLNELGEDVILRQKIRCGDAMHFQGKEADVVMISMVAASPIRADSGRMYEQRYNVACSRGRDRMYVFRSFERAELSDGDLRIRLLDHLDNPLGMDEPRVKELRDLCESEFEREVYDELVIRGFQVHPQVRAGGYRIDMVAEGSDDQRLAIECDGDQYHGVDRWMEDLTRQRVLERMGWRFWRCWASSWIANREGCLEDLIEALTAQGIKPDSSRVHVQTNRPRLVEHRVVEPQRTEDLAYSGEPTPSVKSVEELREVIQESRSGATTSAISAQMREQDLAPKFELNSSAGVAETELLPYSEHYKETIIQHHTVDINDLVTYVNVEAPENLLSVRIVQGQSDPKAGLINQQTPLAEALLGAEEGETIEAHLPMGTTKFRILEVCRPERRSAFT